MQRMISILFISVFAAVASFFIAVQQIYFAPIDDTAFIVSQVLLITVVIVCLIFGIAIKRSVEKVGGDKIMYTKEELAEEVPSYEEWGFINEEFSGYRGSIYKDNFNGVESQNVRVYSREGEDIIFFAVLPNDKEYTGADVVRYIRLAKKIYDGYYDKTKEEKKACGK